MSWMSETEEGLTGRVKFDSNIFGQIILMVEITMESSDIHCAKHYYNTWRKAKTSDMSKLATEVWTKTGSGKHYLVEWV